MWQAAATAVTVSDYLVLLILPAYTSRQPTTLSSVRDVFLPSNWEIRSVAIHTEPATEIFINFIDDKDVHRLQLATKTERNGIRRYFNLSRSLSLDLCWRTNLNLFDNFSYLQWHVIILNECVNRVVKVCLVRRVQPTNVLDYFPRWKQKRKTVFRHLYLCALATEKITNFFVLHFSLRIV